MTVPCWLTTAIVAAAPVVAAQNATVSRSGHCWVIEATGTAQAPPELLHLLMKMEYESALAANSAIAGEKQLKEFLAAVEKLGVRELKWRVVNNVITPAESSTGFVYTRNIVFDLPAAGYSPAELDAIVARLEDLGARYNSHCVTCIGSG